jgi:hypothetical protein
VVRQEASVVASARGEEQMEARRRRRRMR